MLCRETVLFSEVLVKMGKFNFATLLIGGFHCTLSSLLLRWFEATLSVCVSMEILRSPIVIELLFLCAGSEAAHTDQCHRARLYPPAIV